MATTGRPKPTLHRSLCAGPHVVDRIAAQDRDEQFRQVLPYRMDFRSLSGSRWPSKAALRLPRSELRGAGEVLGFRHAGHGDAVDRRRGSGTEEQEPKVGKAVEPGRPMAAFWP